MTTFISIALAAFVFVLGGLLLGHGHDADHGVDGEHSAIVSLFSTRVLATFAMGFGASGAVATYYGLSVVVASAVGVASGVALGLVMWVLFGLIAGQQGSSLVASSELIGALGTVTTSIGANALGEVSVTHRETCPTFLARAQSGGAIAVGRAVRVVRAEGSLLFVEEAAVVRHDSLKPWSVIEGEENQS